MNHHEFVDYVDEQLVKVREIVRAKDADYAGADATSFASNFYEEAQALGLTPEQIWHVWAYKHWSAVTSYCREGRVESEGIEGRLHDVIGYSLLLLGIIEEKKGPATMEHESRLGGV